MCGGLIAEVLLHQIKPPPASLPDAVLYYDNDHCFISALFPALLNVFVFSSDGDVAAPNAKLKSDA